MSSIFWLKGNKFWLRDGPRCITDTERLTRQLHIPVIESGSSAEDADRRLRLATKCRFTRTASSVHISSVRENDPCHSDHNELSSRQFGCLL